MEAKQNRRIDKNRIIDFSKKAGTISFLLLATVGVVIATFFASVTTFPQTDHILINEASNKMADNQVILAQLQTKKDRGDTLLNPSDWPLFVTTFNKALGYNSSVFKMIDYDFTATSSDTLFSQSVVVADITTHFYNPLSSSNNIVFLTNNNMKHFGDNSIIIERSAADQIIDLSSTDQYATYTDLYDYPLNIVNERYSDTYFVSGVYDKNRSINRRDFNGIFAELGNTFFVSTNAAMKYGSGKIYVSFTNDYVVNQKIFTFLRKLITDFGLMIQIPSLQLNNIGIDGISLYELRERITVEYFSIYNVLLSILMWIITISLIIIIVDIFDDVRKYIASMLGDHKMQGVSIAISLIILSLFFFAGSALHAFLFKYYYLNGYIIDFIFTASVTSLICVYFIIIIFSFLTSYRSVVYSRAKYLPCSNFGEFISLVGAPEKKIVTHDYIREYPRNALIIGGLSLPCESAGANRIKASVKILNEGDMKCHVLGYYAGEIGKSVAYEPGYDIIPYHDLRKSSLLSKIKAFLLPFISIKKIVNNFANSNQTIDLIYIYSALSIGAVLFIKKFAKKNGIPLVYDVVEFQLFTQQNFKTFFTYFLPNQIINRFMIKKDDKVIAISSFLKTFFARKKCDAYVMPYVNDTSSLRFVIDNAVLKKTEKVVFMYAGNPFGRRDLIAEMVKGFLMLDKNAQESITVVFAGINAVQCLTEGLTYDEIEMASKFCMFLGKIPHENVKKLYQIADYSILLKPEKKRFSHAGFPTKIAESWGYGVPVVANYSSDLKDYMFEGYNAIVSSSSSPNDFRDAVARAININRVAMIEMRKNSRFTSETKLDYRQYQSGLLEYLGISKNKGD